VNISEFHPGDTKLPKTPNIYRKKKSKYQHNVSLNLPLEVKKTKN